MLDHVNFNFIVGPGVRCQEMSQSFRRGYYSTLNDLRCYERIIEVTRGCTRMRGYSTSVISPELCPHQSTISALEQ
jgi:hypothetical protein